MSLSTPLHPGMGPAILDRLARMDELPKFGTVAGQAVASAIDDIWGKGGGVYNDIDVFVPVDSSKITTDKAAEAPWRFTPLYAESAAYGEMQKYLLQVGTYRLVKTTRRGMVNSVLIDFSGELRCADHSKRVISSFDLNCTRVAVDLRTKRLVWDRHFEQFLRNRELRIVTAHTPVHTFLRLLSKRRQLANVTVDVETAARTCFVMQEASLREELRAKRAASFVFGEKYRQLADDLHADWAAYYDWGDDWFHLEASRHEDEDDEWKPGVGDETALQAVNLHTLLPRGELEPVYKKAAAELGAFSVVILPSRIYAERELFRGSLVSGHRFEAEASKNPDTRLLAYGQARGMDYLHGLSAITDWVGLNDFLKSPVGAETYGLSAKEQLEVLAELKNLATPLGVPDAAGILAEAYAKVKVLHGPDLLPVAQEILEEERKRFFTQDLAPLTQRMQVNPLREPVTVTELTSLRQLKELSMGLDSTPIPLRGRFGPDYRYVLLEDSVDRTLVAIATTSRGKLADVFRAYNWTPNGGAVADHHQEVLDKLKSQLSDAGLVEKDVTAAIPF